MDDTVVSVFDESGALISSNEAHAKLVGRPHAFMIGQSWRDWTPDALRSQGELAFGRCLSGEPIAMLTQILRADGTVALCRSRGFVTRLASRLFVVNTMQIISLEPDIVPREAFGIAEYINDMASALSQMSKQAGLKQLGKALEGVAQEAGEVADLLKDDAASRH